MRGRRVTAVALAVSFWAVAAAAQAVPGTRSYAAGLEGWQAIRAGRNQEAADAFARAIVVEPRDPVLHLGSGMAALLLGRNDVAQQSLERALVLAPGYTAASLLLGDIRTRAGDISGAIGVYEVAQRYAPADKAIIARLETLRRDAEVHSGFYASPGAHFTVLFEGPGDEELARRALDLLEAAYWRITTALSTFPDRTVTVILYTEEQFRDITRSPDWAAAAYDGRIRLPVRGVGTNVRELERVLAHELAHALIQAIAPRGVPTWLHEGLAVTFEGGGAEWADEELARSSTRLSLERLARPFAGLNRADARVAYAQSAAAARMLLDEAGPAAVVAMLQDMAGGEPFAVALERRLFLSYESFVARFR